MPFVLAAGTVPAFVPQVVAIVAAAALVGYVCARLRVVPIVGFLLAGVLIGPRGLGLVTDEATVDQVAEIGVVLLLFTIGIEFSLDRLARIRRTVLIGGGAQVLGVTAVVTGLGALAGLELRTAVFTGFLVSLSSTAIVLKVLEGRGGTTSPRGRTALAFLVLQDLAVVGMVLLVPVLAGDGRDGATELVRALGLAAVVVVVALVVARRVLPRLLEAVARACSPEVFLLTVVALCLGTAAATAYAGLSLSLGAFLAGLVVSESRHSSHVLGEILPLQILFAAAFFLSVGMLLDVRFLLAEPLLVAAAVVAVLVVKTGTSFVAARLAGVATGTALSAALVLAQVGEFAFVLERSGRELGLSPAGLGDRGNQAFIVASVLLMLATPALAAAGEALERRIGQRAEATQAAAGRRGSRVPPGEPGDAAGSDHVLVSGWGPHSRAAADTAAALGLPVTVVTLNPDGAAAAEELGHRVVLGDSTKQQVLLHAGARSARLVVIADDDDEQTARIAAVAAPLTTGPVLVRVAGDPEPDALHRAGATHVVSSARSAVDHLAVAVGRVLQPGEARTRAALLTVRPTDPGAGCIHLADEQVVVPSGEGCATCERTGQQWVHLRVCLTCGEVGCCDSSPGQHASAHAAATGHAAIASFEPGDRWAWCYVDRLEVSVDVGHGGHHDATQPA